MSIQGDKAMKLKDGKILYDDLRTRIELKADRLYDGEDNQKAIAKFYITEDLVGAPIKVSSVYLGLQQAGEGIPTPNNIRTITPHTEINIWHARGNLLNAPVEKTDTIVSFGGTISNNNADKSLYLPAGNYVFYCNCPIETLIITNDVGEQIASTTNLNDYNIYELELDTNQYIRLLITHNNNAIEEMNSILYQLEYEEAVARFIAPTDNYKYSVSLANNPIYIGEFRPMTGEIIKYAECIDLSTVTWTQYQYDNNKITCALPNGGIGIYDQVPFIYGEQCYAVKLNEVGSNNPYGVSVDGQRNLVAYFDGVHYPQGLLVYLRGDSQTIDMVTPINIRAYEDCNTVWSTGEKSYIEYPVDTIDYISNHTVEDVQVNGTSVVSDGVANIPVAGANNLGVVKASSPYGIDILSNVNPVIVISQATEAMIKEGTNWYKPLGVRTLPNSIFYGLTKLAGVDMASSSNAVGTYTDAAKGAIQSMLGITDIIGNEENSLTASKAYSVGEVLTANGKLYRVTVDIAQEGAIVVEGTGQNVEEISVAEDYPRDVKVNGTSILNNGVANVPIAGNNGNYGLVKVNMNSSYNGLIIMDQGLTTYPAAEAVIKAASEVFRPITPYYQHYSTFYGLAKAAGDSTQSASSNAVGAYTDDAKVAIRTMLGAIGSTDYASANTAGVVKVGSGLFTNGNNQIAVDFSGSANIKTGTATTSSISPAKQHESVFYGLAKAAGDLTQSASDNAVGTYTADAKSAIQSMLGVPGDVQINGTSVVQNGIANVPVASSNNVGVVKVDPAFGTAMRDSPNESTIMIRRCPDADVKNGIDLYRPLVPGNQHLATFYGLAKAAGDSTQSASSNAVGTYTDNAKASIKSMLGISDASTDVTVSGTTPSINAIANARYLCGEVSTISFTPSSSGICEVIFTTGSSAAILTVPNTVKFPEWFDALTLEANTIYDISIVDGVYGAVMTWPS